MTWHIWGFYKCDEQIVIFFCTTTVILRTVLGREQLFNHVQTMIIGLGLKLQTRLRVDNGSKLFKLIVQTVMSKKKVIRSLELGSVRTSVYF